MVEYYFETNCKLRKSSLNYFDVNYIKKLTNTTQLDGVIAIDTQGRHTIHSDHCYLTYNYAKDLEPLV